jgi:hypothetical protein
MALLEILTTLSSGGIIGGLLGLGNRFLDLRQKREDRAHELAMAAALRDSQAMLASWEAFKASQDAARAESEAPTFPWVAAIRTLTRPALTLFLVVIAAAIYFTADAALRGDIAWQLLALAGTALGWWFGSRPAELARKPAPGGGK